MKIQIDAKEQSRIKPAYSFYNKKHNVTVEDLPAGDYVFDDEVVFEYKTFDDFIGSIMDKRVFNQSIRQRETYTYHFVILELGDDFNLHNALKKRYYKNKNPVKIPVQEYYKLFTDRYYGAISKLNTYTTVIPVAGDKKTCFRVMLKQAEKCLAYKIIVKYPEVKTANSALNFLCNDVRGIGVVTAEKITDTLQLETLQDLINLKTDDLMSIEGIGEKTAKNIIKNIKVGGC